MEYVYSAMILHSEKKEINEGNVTKILEATGAQVDSSRVKALVASLKDVNIEEAIEKAAVQPAAVAQAQAPAQSGGSDEGKKEEPKEPETPEK